MSEFLEKVAQENANLADVIIKVAEDEIVSKMTPEDQLDELLGDLEEQGVDLESPEVLNALKTASDNGEIYAYNLEKAADFMSEDILKVAAGEPGFETQAAAKAMEQFFDLNGAALLGSSFGTAPNEIGTTIHPGIDKNVMGGFGKTIMTTNIQPAAVQASGKIKSLLGGSNMNIIKAAEAGEDEIRNFLYTKIAEAAELEGQSVDEYVHDLGMEALTEEVKVAGEKTEKVKNFLKSIPGKAKSIFTKKKEESKETKEASDAAYEYVEKVASENGVDPEDIILEYGIQKAAEVLDAELAKQTEQPEATEKVAGLKGMLTSMGNSLKSKGMSALESASKAYKTEGGRAATGAVAGAGLGTLLAARKNKGVDDKKTKIKNYLLGGLGGAAAGAGATALGESVVRGLGNSKSILKAPLTVGSKASLLKQDMGAEIGRRGEQLAKVKGMLGGPISKVKGKITGRTKSASAEEDNSFENTLYTLAQEKLYNTSKKEEGK